jgi:hypothetical protein
MRAHPTRFLAPGLVLSFAGAAMAGAVVDDFTGDGRLDVVVSGGDAAGSLRLLGLEGAGAATDLTDRHGLDAFMAAGELRAVDADGDGRLDLLVLPAPGAGESLRLLVRDDGDVFRDATKRAGLGGVEAPAAAAFCDLDLDGHLDLVVGTAAAEPPFVRIWKGKGDGTFGEITGTAGVTAGAPCVGIAVGDTDRDDLPELYLSLRDAPNALWRNLGAGTFAPAESAALAAPVAGGPVWFLDYDNDRDWDLLLGPPAAGGGPRLFDNERDEGWKETTAARGLDALTDVRRLALGDLDNDGYEELVVETAGAVVVLRNDRGGKFAPMNDEAAPSGLAPGEALAVGDLDYDGDQDILVSAERIADGKIFGAGAHRNPGNDHLWVSVGLKGPGTNRFGVGGTVRILAVDERGRRRDYFRRVGQASASGGSLRQDFGMGQAERILWLEVYFPATKQWQSYYQPKFECTLIVEEGAPEPVTIFRGPPTAGWRRR